MKSGMSMDRQKSGDAGYRSRYLSHAKRALYHLSYAPSMASCPDIVKSVPGRQQSKQVFKDKLRSLNQNDDLYLVSDPDYCSCCSNKTVRVSLHHNSGGVAQMVERSLSMREVPGSIPGASRITF